MMLLLALSCCKVPVPRLLLEFGYIPVKHNFSAQPWHPELSKDHACNNRGSRPS